MGHIEIRERKGRHYAYYVKRDDSGSRITRYVGPVSKTDLNGAVCPRCGKSLRDRTIRQAIARQLSETRDRMRERKDHISDYARYAIVEELIRAFSE